MFLLVPSNKIESRGMGEGNVMTESTSSPSHPPLIRMQTFYDATFVKETNAMNKYTREINKYIYIYVAGQSKIRLGHYKIRV